MCDGVTQERHDVLIQTCDCLSLMIFGCIVEEMREVIVCYSVGGCSDLLLLHFLLMYGLNIYNVLISRGP